MTETFPIVSVLKDMHGNNVESVSFNFRYAPDLCDEAIAAFERVLVGNTVDLGEPDICVNQQPDTPGFCIVLGRPTSNMPLLDSLLKVVAEHCGYRMVHEARPAEEGGAPSSRKPSWRDEPQG